MKIFTQNTKRAFENLAIGLNSIRVAKFSELYNSDLKRLIKQHLAFIYYQDKNYGFFFYAKNAFNTNSELFLNCFNECGVATHTVDELSSKYCSILFKAIEESQFALKEFIDREHKQVFRIYSYQHIGDNEINHYKFGTTYSQTHWHIYAVNEDDISNSRMQEHYECRYLNTFNDFFLELYAELFNVNSLRINYKLGSITLLEKPISLKITSEEIQIVKDVMIKWKIIWKDFASCFTDFEYSRQGRFLLRDKDVTIKLLNNMCNKYSVSPNSTRRLLWLANNINKYTNLNDFDSKEYWRTIHLGVNGSIGFVHDYDKKKTFLNVAPRTFATLERIGCLDGLYFSKKNRKEYLSKREISRLEEVQKKLYAIIDERISSV